MSEPSNNAMHQGAEVWPSHFVGGQSLRRALRVKPGVRQTEMSEGAPTLIRTPVVAGLGRAGRAVEKEAEQWPLPEITPSDAGLARSRITRA